LYLLVLSPLAGAPVFMKSDDSPTAKSAMKESSVSPLLWLTIVFIEFLLAKSMNSKVSVIVHI